VQVVPGSFHSPEQSQSVLSVPIPQQSLAGTSALAVGMTVLLSLSFQEKIPSFTPPTIMDTIIKDSKVNVCVRNFRSCSAIYFLFFIDCRLLVFLLYHFYSINHTLVMHRLKKFAYSQDNLQGKNVHLPFGLS
jgi:hypothetical protein